MASGHASPGLLTRMGGARRLSSPRGSRGPRRDLLPLQVHCTPPGTWELGLPAPRSLTSDPFLGTSSWYRVWAHRTRLCAHPEALCSSQPRTSHVGWAASLAHLCLVAPDGGPTCTARGGDTWSWGSPGTLAVVTLHFCRFHHQHLALTLERLRLNRKLLQGCCHVSHQGLAVQGSGDRCSPPHRP